MNDNHLHSYPVDLFTKAEEEKVAWAPHFYDGFLLLTKNYYQHLALSLHKNVLFHAFFIKNSFLNSIMAVSSAGKRRVATLFGEVGVPFDLEGVHFKDFSAQRKGLDR